MCAQIPAVDAVLVVGWAVVGAELASTDGDVGAFIALEAGAGHGDAEAVADADVEV